MKYVAALLLALTPLTTLANKILVPAPPQLAAKSYLLMDAATGHLLVSVNVDERLPPASLTKIMTSYLAAEFMQQGVITAEDQVPVSVKAWRMVGSKMFIRSNTKVNLMDLLRGVIIQSGNDASVAVAEHLAGSEEAFAGLMNQHAGLLGMDSTNYVNSTGLSDENHYTTAKDVALLTAALIRRFPEHYAIYAERDFTYDGIRQNNRNRLLWQDNRVDGVKTGHTEAAGYCLVSSAQEGSSRMIAVVMGSASDQERIAQSRKLLNYGFRFFETVPVYAAAEPLKKLRVWGGKRLAVNVGLAEELTLTVVRSSRDDLSAQVSILREARAPFAAGEELGRLTVILPDGTTVVRPLVTLEGVEEAGFFSRLWDSSLLFLLRLFGWDTYTA